MKPAAGAVTRVLRDRLGASVAGVAATRRRRAAERSIRPERFWSFGAGSVIEPPFRVAHAEYVEVGSDVRIRPNAWLPPLGANTP